MITFVDMSRLSYIVHLLVFLSDIFCHFVKLTVVDTSVLELTDLAPHKEASTTSYYLLQFDKVCLNDGASKV